MKVALVHDWLTGMRGGERVLEEFCEFFPDACVFTLIHKPGSVSRRIESMPIRTSFLNRIPGAMKYYPYLLPLYPLAISKLNLSSFDFVLSISHAAAKGVRKAPGSIHLCYCLTPMRYIWDMQDDYFQYADRLRLKRAALQVASHPLRSWDCATARNVDYFIANSQYVQNRIKRYYDRDSDVIYSPVDTEFFTPSSNGHTAGFYLMVSALVSYKRLDIAIDAFNHLGFPLVIVGTGPDLSRLKVKAGPNIQFRGFVRNEELRNLYRQCRAVVITAREDFGLVSLEAQACGRPPIAYAAGGSLESIIDGSTGILFEQQRVDSLIQAVGRFGSLRFNRERMRANAKRFSSKKFRQALGEYLKEKLPMYYEQISQHKFSNSVLISSNRTTSPNEPHPSVMNVAKRGFDIIFSTCAILILFFPLLVLALLIRLQSPGPAFYSQTRIGYRGRKFTIFKLRTMYEGAERNDYPIWAVENDPRCTPLGGFLRKYGIDELPQLWNCLKGDMSLIGPRPERPEFHNIFAADFPDFSRRLGVRGGITGLAQIRGWRGNTSIRARLESDLEYMRHWSLTRDLRILIQTPLALMHRFPSRTKKSRNIVAN